VQRDEVIDVAGRSLSLRGIEQVLVGHPDVTECAVVGVADELRGHVPVGFAVVRSDTLRDSSDIADELVTMVRHALGRAAAFREVRIVSRLPRSQSGEILFEVIRAIAEGDMYTVPDDIADPAALEEITDAVAPDHDVMGRRVWPVPTSPPRTGP
jgi:propionyl-CoA synthetase